MTSEENKLVQDLRNKLQLLDFALKDVNAEVEKLGMPSNVTVGVGIAHVVAKEHLDDALELLDQIDHTEVTVMDTTASLIDSISKGGLGDKFNLKESGLDLNLDRAGTNPPEPSAKSDDEDEDGTWLVSDDPKVD